MIWSMRPRELLEFPIGSLRPQGIDQHPDEDCEQPIERNQAPVSINLTQMKKAGDSQTGHYFSESYQLWLNNYYRGQSLSILSLSSEWPISSLIMSSSWTASPLSPKASASSARWV